MAKPRSKDRRFRILAFSFVLVVIPFITYYFFYVTRQTSYFTNRDLRTLSALSSHVKEKVESQSEVFRNAVQNYLELCTALGNDQCIDWLAEATPGSLKQTFQANALDVLKGDGTYLTATSVAVIPQPQNSDALPVNPDIAIQQEDGDRWLYLTYVLQYEPTEKQQTSNGKQTRPKKGQARNAPSPYLSFEAKTNLNNLIGSFVNQSEVKGTKGFQDESGFDAILIASVDDDAEVIFQQSPAELQVASLSSLRLAADDEKKVDVNQISRSTNLVDVKLAGEVYKLFIQPIELPLFRAGSDRKHGIQWLACGLVRASDFRNESWSISYTLLIVFGFLTALVALSWPFIKLASLGKKDNFRPMDAYFLVLSTVIIAAMLTFFMLFVYSYSSAEARLDGRMQEFAKEIRRNFNKELDAALRELDELNANSELTATFQNIKTLQDHSTDTNQRAKAELYVSHARERSAILDGPLKATTNSYPYFTSAFWADPQGQQRIKWTVRKDVTRRIPIGDRPYFEDIQEGRFQRLGTHEFGIQPILSKTTGGNEVIISKAIHPFDDQAMWVSAIDTRLISLMQPVVPTGFGFAVISDAGKVLFHSEEKQHLGENFYEECDNNHELLSAVLGRGGESLNAQYLGKGHRLYVEPLGNSNWTLIVFRNKNHLRTVFSEVMTLSLFLFITYFVLLLALLVSAYMINRKRRERAAWLWPVKEGYDLYARCIVLNLLLGAFSVFSLYVFTGWQMVLVPVLFSFAGILLTMLVLKRKLGLEFFDPPARFLKRLASFSHRKAYIGNALLLFTLIGIVPAWACFQLSYDEELRLFIKEGQLNLARDLAEREERIRSQYAAIVRQSENPAAIERIITKRLADDNLDVYVSFFFGTRIGEVPATHDSYTAETENGLVGFYGNFVPLFNQSSIERHGLVHARAADESWHWEQAAPDTLVLHTNGALSSTQRISQRHIASTIPQLPRSFLWWLILPLLIFSIGMLLSYMIRRVFLFQLRETRSDRLADVCNGGLRQNMFLILGQPFTSKGELLMRLHQNSPPASRIDIQEKAQVEKWAEQYEPGGEDCHAIVLDNFDYAIDNPAINEQKLLLLEKLHNRRKFAIAVSTLAPEDYSFSNGEVGAATANARGIRIANERWAGAVSRFLKVTLEDVGDPEKFKEDLKLKKRKILETPGLSRMDRSRLEQVFAIVERECAPGACLQSIGEGLTEQPGVMLLDRESVTSQILAHAYTFYEALWFSCSNDEKLTLSHLGKNRLLSPKDPDTERLYRRGLIVRDPDVRLMNGTFRSFVTSAAHGKLMAECEDQARVSSGWEALKLPLVLILSSIVLFMFVTQRDLYNSALAIITAVTAGVPTIFRLLAPGQRDDAARPGRS